MGDSSWGSTGGTKPDSGSCTFLSSFVLYPRKCTVSVLQVGKWILKCKVDWRMETIGAQGDYVLALTPSLPTLQFLVRSSFLLYPA